MADSKARFQRIVYSKPAPQVRQTKFETIAYPDRASEMRPVSPNAVYPRLGQFWSVVNTGVLVDRLILTLALSAGLILRLWQINALGFNSDEAVYAGQAAAIAGEPSLKEFFPMFRAHPLLFQFVLALGLPFVGIERLDILGRLLAAAMGFLTVVLVYQIGAVLYRPRVGAFAALFMALMPYHVVVSRQALLDGPMTLFSTLSLYFLARFAASQRSAWLYAAGASMGLTFLAKETAILLVGGIYIFLALSPEIRSRIRDLITATACMGLIMLVFPLSPMLAGGGGGQKATGYLVWQLFRRPNHTWDFYPTTVPIAIGPLVVLTALLGLWVMRRQITWREKLLVSWIVVPCIFFQLWPVKGFQYLLPITAPLAILAARALHITTLTPALELRMTSFQRNWLDPSVAACRRLLSQWMSSLETRSQLRILHYYSIANRSTATARRALRTSVSRLCTVMYRELRPHDRWRFLAAGIIALSILLPTWQRVQPSTSDQFLAGSGGIPGGREAGAWVRTNTPEGSTFMALGPSMANIIQFYGGRKAYGLSVSTNPLHRNPSYEPLRNPDFSIRTGELQYIVWDSYSAARSQFFSDSLNRYVKRYNGRVVHTESVTVRSPDGNTVLKPVIIIYEVRP
jgi:hypothetical protein